MSAALVSSRRSEELDSTRIRAFLARTRPLTGNEVPVVYWEGRELIETLAASFDLKGNYHWDASDCSTVLEFLCAIEPTAGNCFCNDESAVNATCGFHAILEHLADDLHRVPQKAKVRKRPA
jgi:hypothetical protein